MSSALDQLDHVSLAELDEAQLQNRIESKIIVSTDDVPAILERVASDYRVMQHNGERVQRYSNEYFDSPDLRNYHQHHNRHGRRLKLRYRSYCNSNLTFFEVKRSVHGRTMKERQQSTLPEGHLWAADAEFFRDRAGTCASTYSPVVTIEYNRILLVNHDFTERMTIDLDLSFASPSTATTMPGLAVLEIKQPKFNRRSPAMNAVNRRPQSFSKYCIGLASCDPSLRRNRFKHAFRDVATLQSSHDDAESSP